MAAAVKTEIKTSGIPIPLDAVIRHLFFRRVLRHFKQAVKRKNGGFDIIYQNRRQAMRYCFGQTYSAAATTVFLLSRWGGYLYEIKLFYPAFRLVHTFLQIF